MRSCRGKELLRIVSLFKKSWDVPRTGKRKGTKEGRKLNGSCEWHETWEADDCPTPRSVGDFWIDKHWRKQEHDGRVGVKF